jgi:plasmid stabilization system protein ParE
MKLRFSRRSLQQIREIQDFVAADNPQAAERITRRIEILAALLAKHPSIGRPTRYRNTRVLSALPYPYLIFYTVDVPGNEVTVLRVRHMARRQDWRKGR